jgi:hypothetical protein
LFTIAREKAPEEKLQRGTHAPSRTVASIRGDGREFVVGANSIGVEAEAPAQLVKILLPARAVACL